MKDTRNDFSAAIRSLRASAAFIEGSSLDDTEAHFVIQKIQSSLAQNGGQKYTTSLGSQS